MRVLVFIDGYYPAKNYGGPVESIFNIVEQSSEVQFFIITRDHDLNSHSRLKGIKRGWNIYGRANVNYLSNEEANIRNIIYILEEINPDCIYINSLYDYKGIIASKLYMINRDIKLVIAPRGQLSKSALNIKKNKKYFYLKFFNLFLLEKKWLWHSTSKLESENILGNVRVEQERIFEIANLSRTFNKITKNRSDEILNIVTVARVCEMKNLIYSIDVLKDINVRVNFDIYGNIEDEIYWSKCRESIKKIKNKKVTINYCGILEKEEFEKKFKKYEVFLMPTLGENYGHSIVEAMALGCIPVISDRTPWSDINEFGCGYSISLNKRIEYIKKITYLSEIGLVEREKMTEILYKYLNKKVNNKDLVFNYENLFKYGRC